MSRYGLRSFANLLAYIAVILVGVALIIRSVFSGSVVAYWVKFAADIIAYVMLAVSSFAYARSRRNVIYIVLWLAAIVLIVVSYIL